MQDPIPPPPALLQSLVTPLATALDLPTLPLHIHEVLAIAALYTFVQLRASPYLARHLLPRLYASFSPRTRASWDIHVVALVQACIISAVAVWVLWHDRDRWGMDWTERVWGYTGADGLIVALAVGYFSWDLMVCTVYLRTFGVGMLAHALSALAVYAFGFRPLVNNYAPNFILYELSSPFLNAHWCLDKLNLTGSRTQLVNGAILLVSFFLSRLVWGPWQSFRVSRDVIRAYYYVRSDAAALPLLASSNSTLTDMRFASGPASKVPLWLVAVYITSNVVLNALNFYWFAKMITAIRKRFTGEISSKSEKTEFEERERVTVEYTNGAQVIGVEQTKARRRRG